MTRVLPPRRYKLSTGQFVLIDAADAPLMQGATWYGKKSDGSENYHAAHGTKDNGTVRLHRVITKAKKGERIEFLNGNGLDCRRTNLLKVKIS